MGKPPLARRCRRLRRRGLNFCPYRKMLQLNFSAVLRSMGQKKEEEETLTVSSYFYFNMYCQQVQCSGDLLRQGCAKQQCLVSQTCYVKVFPLRDRNIAQYITRQILCMSDIVCKSKTTVVAAVPHFMRNRKFHVPLICSSTFPLLRSSSSFSWCAVRTHGWVQVQVCAPSYYSLPSFSPQRRRCKDRLWVIWSLLLLLPLQQHIHKHNTYAAVQCFLGLSLCYILSLSPGYGTLVDSREI